MIYDSKRKKTVLFGGMGATLRSNCDEENNTNLSELNGEMTIGLREVKEKQEIDKITVKKRKLLFISVSLM